MPLLPVKISDSTSDLTALFHGRDRIPGLICDGKVRLRGQAEVSDSSPVMENPAYELLIPDGAGRDEY